MLRQERPLNILVLVIADATPRGVPLFATTCGAYATRLDRVFLLLTTDGALATLASHAGNLNIDIRFVTPGVAVSRSRLLPLPASSPGSLQVDGRFSVFSLFLNNALHGLSLIHFFPAKEARPKKRQRVVVVAFRSLLRLSTRRRAFLENHTIRSSPRPQTRESIRHVQVLRVQGGRSALPCHGDDLGILSQCRSQRVCRSRIRHSGRRDARFRHLEEDVQLCGIHRGGMRTGTCR